MITALRRLLRQWACLHRYQYLRLEVVPGGRRVIRLRCERCGRVRRTRCLLEQVW